MIENQLIEIKKAFNEILKDEIKTSRDCVKLASEITDITSREISSTTIRRVFGILKSNGNLSKYNLHTLNLYLELVKDSYLLNRELDISLHSNEVKQGISSIFKTHGGFNKSFLDDLMVSHINPQLFTIYLQMAISFSLKKEDVRFFESFFKLPPFVLVQPVIIRHLGNELFKKDNSKWMLESLAEIKSARLYFFEQYINIGHFQSYLPWLKIYIRHEAKTLKKLWAESIVIFGTYLSAKNINWTDFNELLKNSENDLRSAHPYVKARIYGVGLLSEQHRPESLSAIEAMIKVDIEEMNSDANYFPFFSEMIFQYVLILGKVENERKSLMILMHQVFSMFKSRRTWIEEAGILHYKKIVVAILNQTTLNLKDIKQMESGHTNEDIHTKLFLLNELNLDSKEYSKAISYKQELLEESGFMLFK